MSVEALARGAATTRPAPARRIELSSLAAKLALAFLGLVAFVLIVNGAIDAWLTYSQAKRAALEVEAAKAQRAADRVGMFLSDIQTELGWTAGPEWGLAKPEQQRYDFVRMLRQAPAIMALSYLDPRGQEQLAVSRLEPDVVGSGKDFSADPRFVRAVADKVWFGPVEFRRGSEPYMTIALAHVGKTPGVTVADVNLKLIWDMVSTMHVGEKGFAYVVDDRGRLIAHPDLSLALRDSDVSQLPQVAEALGRPDAGAGSAAEARSLDGAAVLTAFAIAPKTHWAVFVEQPLAEALAPAYSSLARAAGLLVLGLALAAVSGMALARRIASPIRALQAGAERLGAGDLRQRLDIRTGDEIEALAGSFNQMAGRLQESYETLEAKVEARTRELEEALVYQTGSASILKVIASSPTDVAPVLQAIVDSACEVCDAYDAAVILREGDFGRFVAHRGPIPIGMQGQPLSRAWVGGRAVLDRAPVHVADLLAESETFPVGRDMALQMGHRTILAVPLMREDESVGAILVRRNEVHPFGDKQIALLRSFADQAVIAIENTRLFEEVRARTSDLQEALQQQTATADVLKVISRSVFDLNPVLQTLIDTAVGLARGSRGTIFLRQGGVLVARAFHSNVPEELRKYLASTPWPLDGDSQMAKAVSTRAIVHIADLSQSEGEGDRETRKRAAFGAGLWIPLMRGEEAIGVFGVPREAPIAFSDREIELVQSFADQAVIAIENSRLFEQVQAKTRDLERSLERQTATTEILRVISHSPTDARPVFESIVVAAARLLRCDKAWVMLVEGEFWRNAALATPDGLEAVLLSDKYPVDPALNFPSRAIVSKTMVSLPDWSELELPEHQRRVRELYGFQSSLHLPFLREGECVGVLSLVSRRAHAFGEEEIAQSESFRDQAQIAIENARLFNETQESLAQQTATAEVLQVISRSAFDLDAVFQTLVTTAVDLCKASSGTLCVRDGDVYRYRGMAGPESTPELRRYLEAHPLSQPNRGTIAGRAILSRAIEQIRDILREPDYAVPFAAHGSPARALLGVPLLGKAEVLGAIVVARAEPGAFPDRHIEILKTFADQAVIAIENARLFDEVQSRTRELEASLSDLRKAQDQLVQSEKLASLGQLTAGIAHEIKNPLNFVNNFATLSRELMEELRAALDKAPLDAPTREEVEDLASLIDGNLDKVATHGRRADSIVKNMLLHSREGSGERGRVNVNAMLEEALNLAYHGARADKRGFNVTIEKAFDPAAGEAELYVQEITRVLLNLAANGFYATAKRQETAGAGYAPTLSASTRDLGHNVEIVIRDNGTGVSEAVRAKMFNPFFTTKPAGEGTGLGLSLSHDIVVKQHGGAIDVKSELGVYTEFTIVLPRKSAAS